MPKLTLLELCDRLYELNSTIENLSLENLPPELVEAMDNLLEDRNTAAEEYYEKINSILNLIKNKQQWAQIRKQRIKELQRLVKVDEHLAVKVNQYLLDHLCQEKKTKLRTKDFNVSVAQNGGQIPLKISDNIDLETIPQDLIKVKKELSKEAVRDRLEKGEKLDFACFGERGQHLKIN